MSSCTPSSSRTAGAPQVLALNDGATNPDVLWIVRPIATDVKVPGGKGVRQPTTLYGLFACYRSATPETPECFLASVTGTKESLVWPDEPKRYRFSLDAE